MAIYHITFVVEGVICVRQRTPVQVRPDQIDLSPDVNIFSSGTCVSKATAL